MSFSRRLGAFALAVLLALCVGVMAALADPDNTPAVTPAEPGEPTVTPDEPPVDELTITVSREALTAQIPYYPIQAALNEATRRGTAQAPCTVVVPAGTYVLDRALHLYSNTVLELTDVTFMRDRNCESNMLRVGDEDTSASGPTGYYYENMTIRGGVWDADNTTNTMIKAAHAKNFVMEDVTLQNLQKGHMMEVAGVDGFTLRRCRFLNQVLPKGYNGYEAVQLDVLKEGHIVNCRAEDLPMKNVLVEDCFFDNCPRGVGSHTAVHNRPHDGIVIRNNTFLNMKSVAIQGLGWINCTITGNVIQNTPRGIAVYAAMDNGAGTFLPSVFASEGGTKAHATDAYRAPAPANILIAYNTITGCGTVKDIYSSYEVSAISALGYTFAAATPADPDGSGGLPAGRYYVNGVTVRHNVIDVNGSGVRIENATGVIVEGNDITCHPNTLDKKNYYGMVFRGGVSVNRLVNNYVTGAAVNGLQLDEQSDVTGLAYNELYRSGKYGMGTYASRVGKIEYNRIITAGNEGMALLNASNISEVKRNVVVGTGTYGIHAMADTTVGMIADNFVSQSSTPIGYAKGPGLVKEGANFTAAKSVAKVQWETPQLTLGVGYCYRPLKTIEPVNTTGIPAYSVDNEKVAEVTPGGTVIARAPGNAVVTVTLGGKSATLAVRVVDEDLPPVVEPVPETVSPGDVDGNGAINAKDALAVLKNAVGKQAFTADQQKAADVNADGRVDAKDALEILKKAVGKPACF